MGKAVKISLAVIVLLAVFSLTAYAQDYPKYEFFAGFAYERAQGSNGMGWNASLVKNFNHYLGIAVAGTSSDMTINQSYNGFKFKERDRQFSVLAGPQVKSRESDSKWEPFLHLLMGGGHTSASYSGAAYGSDGWNSFAITFGGGLDARLKGPVAVRVVQLEYMGLRSSGTWQKGLGISAGLVLNLGKATE
jgi:hypothetical protein